MKLQKIDVCTLTICIAAVCFFVPSAREALRSSSDFVAVYTGARCMVHGCSSYDTAQLERQYYMAGGVADQLPKWELEPPVYPPSTLLLVSPLSVFSFPAARVIWWLLNGILVTAACCAAVSLCPIPYRRVAAMLVVIFLEGFSRLLVLGQPAAFAIALLTIGIFLFLRNRLLPLATLGFIFSLAVKPQIGGLIVLYLFVKGVHRRYAGVALSGAVVLLAAGGLTLTATTRSTAWISDLRSTLAGTLVPGAVNDPSPANALSIQDMNIQTITSVLFKSEKTYNDVAFAVVGILLVTLAWVVLRMEPNIENHLIAIGALSAITLMPVYHRFYDSRILLLAIPSAFVVFKASRSSGIVLCALIFLTNYSFQQEIQMFFQHHGLWESTLRHKVLFIALMRQRSLGLLALVCLYIAILARARASVNGAIRAPGSMAMASR